MGVAWLCGLLCYIAVRVRCLWHNSASLSAACSTLARHVQELIAVAEKGGPLRLLQIGRQLPVFQPKSTSRRSSEAIRQKGSSLAARKGCNAQGWRACVRAVRSIPLRGDRSCFQ